VYALDSTTIDLCLSLFPWAAFRPQKGAVKLHTLVDLRGNIPCFIRITHGKIHDVNILDQLVLEAGVFYMMDRGYIDFARLYLFVQALAFFVTRAKSNLDYQRMAYRPVDKTTGLRSDQTIRLQGIKTRRQYPLPLRRISYVDLDTDKRLILEQLGTWGLKLKTFLRNPAALNARVGITRSPGGSDGKEVRASEAVDGGPPSRSGKVRDREGGAMAGMG
jgi:hypothetical protein